MGARRHRHVVGGRELERPHRGVERISQATFHSVAARAIPPLRSREVGNPRFSRVLGRVARCLVGARAYTRYPLALARPQKPRRAGQGLHHAERDLRNLRFRAARTSRRTMARAGAAFARALSCRAGVHRQHRLCGDGAHHARRHGGHVRAVRSSAIRMEGRARRCADWRCADGRGVGILAISTPARVGSRGGAADLRRRRRQHPDRTADRVLEEIAGFHRRGASHRPWNGDNPGAIPTRHDGHDQSRADHHEPAQPDPGGDDRARPRRRRRARRDVARPSRFVS